MSKAIDRLFNYLKFKGIPHTRFEKNIGLSNGYLMSALKRKGGLGEDVLNTIIDNSLDISLEWLVTGKGEMLKESSTDILEEPKSLYKSSQDVIFEQLIPLYDQGTSIGYFKEDTLEKPESYMLLQNIGKCDGCMYVIGDAMSDVINSGDIIAYKFIDDIPEDIIWGNIYVMIITIAGEDQFVIKYVKKSPNSSKIILVSKNKHYDDKEVSLSKIKRIAVVKAVVQSKVMVN